jgi:hypothetical protein
MIVASRTADPVRDAAAHQLAMGVSDDRVEGMPGSPGCISTDAEQQTGQAAFHRVFGIMEKE